MSHFIGSFRKGDDASVTSVGRSLGNNSIYNTSHPAYVRIADAVSTEVAHLAAGDAQRRSRAKPVVMTTILDTAGTEQLAHLYPELRMIDYGMDRPAHSYLTASITMANELVLLRAQKISESVTHLGVSLMSSLMTSDMDVHIEMEPSCASAVHSRDRDTRNTARIMGDYTSLVRDTGSTIARGNYEKYLARTAYSTCTRSASCAHQSEVYCADLATYSMSPSQFCAGMRQCGAQVGYGFFLYHPVMLLSNSGEVPGTGIYFEKTSHSVNFKYPEGVAAVQSYPLADWGAWLSEHVVYVGKGKARASYHVQLSKPRGPFMFFQVTQADMPEEGLYLRHALELPMVEPHYIVTAWTLRNLVSDPSRSESWERVLFTVPSKVIDSLYSFGLQLTPENFSRYALRKQLKVMDRVTLEGSVVTKGFRPSRAQVNVLVTAVHARLFVERYESGRLSSELMSRLKRVSGFGSASRAAKVSAVAMWGMRTMWDNTFGWVGESVTAVCDWIDRLFSRPSAQLPAFTLAPEYVSFETVVSNWRNARDSTYEAAMHDLSSFDVVGSAITLRGGPIASALSKFRDASAGNVLQSARLLSDVSQVVGIGHLKHVSHVDDVPSSLKPVLRQHEQDELDDALVTDLKALNMMDQAPVDRHHMPTVGVVRVEPSTESMQPDYDVDPDYVGTMNAVYEEFNPGMAQQPLERDVASISHDDQDRNLVADYLRLPRVMDMAPKDRAYFKSRVLALGAPKRQETQQELLSSAAARNLAPPKISLPQDNSKIIPDIWNSFLDNMCVPEARDLLASYKTDPVALEEGAYRDWMTKARPDVLQRVKTDLEKFSRSLGEMPVSEYYMMIKADVKPPLSDKPMRSRIEPQVIVYHDKTLSSLYSSVFRVLVKRLLSLLRPEVHLNLTKDNRDIAAFIRANHPYGMQLKYLENDFSKYDKSQDEFVFQLEAYIFGELGMNQALLERWVIGHTDCSIRSFVTGLSLHVRFQRKSGDATTAFGNGLLNIVSVSYAYGISNIAWAVFMGDDSLVACYGVANSERATQVLAEVFNLSAKMYLTDSPYFASNFIVIDEVNNHAELVPDPIKWIEKRSQPIVADDPQWGERYKSAIDAGKVYRHKINTEPLARMVAARYPVSVDNASRLASAVATALETPDNFRGCYEERPETFHY